MSPLSEQARRVVEALLSGESLDRLAPRGTRVRAEVEAHLIDTLEAKARAGTAPGKPLPAAPGGSASRRAASPPPPMPGKGIAVAFSDGASRGNPGPAAVGVRILSADGEELLAEGVAIGRCTNNVAEYRGAIHALTKASELGLDSLELRMDSELVVKQLKGEYRVKQPALAELKEEVDRLRSRFRVLRWKYVPREQNREADLLANEALDRA